MKKSIYTLTCLLSLSIAAAPSCCTPSAPSMQEKAPITTVERTFAMIKPDAVNNGSTGAIIDLIEKNGFRIINMKKLTFNTKQAEAFYAEHKERPFFADLVRFITSGPAIVLELEKENAIADWRTLIGTTDPAQANMGTIRKMFAESKSYNAVHGSDSPAAAKREIGFFF